MRWLIRKLYNSFLRLGVKGEKAQSLDISNFTPFSREGRLADLNFDHIPGFDHYETYGIYKEKCSSSEGCFDQHKTYDIYKR